MTRSLNLSAFLLLVVLIGGHATPREPANGSPDAGPVDVGLSVPAPVHLPARGASHGVPVPSLSPEAAQPSAGAPVSVPAPTGAVGTALVGGWATYYATCAECAAAGPLIQAALGPDWQGRWVTVESKHGKALLRLVTSCACGDRKGVPTVIDVSRQAFNELSPYPAGSAQDPGYVRVSIELPTLPPTDVNPDDERMRREVRDDTLYGGPE